MSGPHRLTGARHERGNARLLDRHAGDGRVRWPFLPDLDAPDDAAPS